LLLLGSLRPGGSSDVCLCPFGPGVLRILLLRKPAQVCCYAPMSLPPVGPGLRSKDRGCVAIANKPFASSVDLLLCFAPSAQACPGLRSKNRRLCLCYVCATRLPRFVRPRRGTEANLGVGSKSTYVAKTEGLGTHKGLRKIVSKFKTTNLNLPGREIEFESVHITALHSLFYN
jgi:hypothetical protein